MSIDGDYDFQSGAYRSAIIDRGLTAILDGPERNVILHGATISNNVCQTLGGGSGNLDFEVALPDVYSHRMVELYGNEDCTGVALVGAIRQGE